MPGGDTIFGAAGYLLLTRLSAALGLRKKMVTARQHRALFEAASRLTLS